MDTMMQLVDVETLPPELALDPDHPHADQFIKNCRNIQRAIVAVSARMSLRQVDVVKRFFSGEFHSNVDAGKAVGVHPATIARWIASNDARELRNLLTYYRAAMDGPNLAQRRNMLWRIAARNEDDDPKTSIAALKELNNVDPEAVAISAPKQAGGATEVRVIINNDHLPKTSLDD